MTNSDPRDTGGPGARSEPEIIPPGRAGRNQSGGIWVSIDENGEARRVHMARPGLLTIVLGLAVLGLIALVMLIVLLSVAVIWIPFVIVLVAAFVASMYWRRFRMWLARR